jgi:anti-anti-sigma factor
LTRPFCVDVLRDRDDIVVEAIGELDLHSADVLEQEVARLHADGHEHVVVDLRQVAFIDSTGLRMLIGLHRSAQLTGRAITLGPGPRQVQRIFELTATDALFDWRD